MPSTTVATPARNPPKIVVIGTIALDVKHFDIGEFRGSRTSVVLWHREQQPGGVGRNVAVNLARLGANPTLVAMSAQDDTAILLERQVAETGVRVLSHRARGTTGRIELMLGKNGDLLGTTVSLPDFAESLAFIRDDIAEVIAESDGVMVETGFDSRFLDWVRERTNAAGIPLCGMPTRSHLLHWYDALVLNEREAARALGARPGGLAVATHHARLIADAHRPHAPSLRRTVVLTRGAAGALLARSDTPEVRHLPAESGPCVDDTGAGDALAAAFFAEVIRTDDAMRALRRGMRAAGWTVRCRRATCSQLSALAVE